MRKILAAFLLLFSALGASAQDRLYSNTFSLGDVQLLDGPFRHACDLNVEVLLQYDMDRLLAPFFIEAGLEPKAAPFPNWQGLDGHVAGHYVSALAMAYAATGNMECHERLKYMLGELKRCQDAFGNGYVGGVPNGPEIFAEVKKGNFKPLHGAWVPWYNVHKTFAGLRDAWLYAGIYESREMFLEMCDWCLDVTGGLSGEQMEDMLSQEFGGMDEVLADAFQITGDRKYIDAAKRFGHRWLLDSMAQGIDDLDNRHANTQVPKAVGYARIADLDGDPKFRSAAEFFWERVSQHRSVVIGGNSRSEHFPAEDDWHSYMEHREGPESCNTNNMLKLTEFLFKISPEARYADFYERALYNHVLSTQHPVHGGYVYFTSMRPSHYRVYSAPNEGMWCCVGTGMENHCKYGQFIYTHEGDKRLSVNLFIASKLSWKANGAVITQETSFPYAESSVLKFRMTKAKKFVLSVRCPEWVKAGEYAIKVGKKVYGTDAKPGSYVDIERKWKNGDVVEISLPMQTRVVALDNDPQFLSVMRGPIVLAAKTSQDHLDGLIADDGRWAHIASGELVPLADTPIMIGTKEEIEARLAGMKPVEGRPMCFTVPGLFNKAEYDDLVLEPFFGIHDSRYAIYFLSLTSDGYEDMLAQIRAEEAAALALDRRTVDKVTPGEQQPEVDHRLKSFNSFPGHVENDPYRAVRSEGYFSYELATGGSADRVLSVTFWADRSADIRVLDILVDGEPIATGKLDPAGTAVRIRNEYPLPAELLEGKDYVTVTFSAEAGKHAPCVLDVRLLEPTNQ